MGGATSDDRSDGFPFCCPFTHSLLQISPVASKHLCESGFVVVFFFNCLLLLLFYLKEYTCYLDLLHQS